MTMRTTFRRPLPAALTVVALACLVLPGAESPASAQPPAQSAPAAQSGAPAAPQPPAPRAFGYDTFRQDAAPITEGPVDDQYILSPGDEVVISTWGELNLLHNLVVSEDGYLQLPDDGGRIQTNGVTLKELKTKVTQALSLIYSSYINAQEPGASTAFVDVKLGKIRKLLLYVVGEVRNPGAYTLSSGTATVVNLLHNAGGVKETGSLRDIRIRRADGRIEVIDLYDFLLTGKLDVRKSRLLTGDYVIVPLKQKAVDVKGEVRRPMNYELVGNEGLKELVAFAGGFTPDAYLVRSQLKRFVINRGEVFLDVNLDSLYKTPAANYAMVDRDELTVLPNVQVRKSMVTIGGDGITRPGTYEFKAGMTLNDLVQRADGLREYAHLDRADLVRTEEDFSKKLTTFSLRDLYAQSKPGVFTFKGNAQQNFALREMDQITIYSEFGMAGQDKYVTIEGHVKQPGRVLLAKNMTLYDLLFARGGFQDTDFLRRAYADLGHVIRKIPGAIGTRLMPFNLGKVVAGDASANFPLADEDIIRVYANEQMIVKAEVTIGGLVNRPGTFPLSEGLAVEDLIVLAGGLRADAYRVEAVIARAEGLGDETATEKMQQATLRVPVETEYATLPAEKKTPLKPFDRITIRNLPGWEPLLVVTLEGEVRYPGSYALESRLERISSVIRRADGLRREALPEGATLQRRANVLEMTPGGSQGTFEITLNLAEALRNPGGDFDLVLKDGDRIFIPTNPGTIEVRGAVRQPLILQYNAAYRLEDYINLCGGYLETADRDNVVIYAANKAATRAKASGGWLGIGAKSPGVSPGSTIEVPFTGETARLETVEVRGAVSRPAVLQYNKGARLGYYLSLTGGYTEEADVDKVAVVQPTGDLLVKRDGAEFNPEVAPGSIIVVTTRAAEVPRPAAAAPAASAAAARLETVEVRGEVGKPAILQHVEGARLEYYINLCGGYSKQADTAKISVQLPSGNLLVKQENVDFNPLIPQGSVIVIPAKPPAEAK